jgi:hypothetical protein
MPVMNISKRIIIRTKNVINLISRTETKIQNDDDLTNFLIQQWVLLIPKVVYFAFV